MMTWRFWSALGQPLHRNPVFRYSAGRPHLRKRWFILWIVIGFVLTCCGVSFAWNGVINFLFYGSPVLLLLLPFAGSTLTGMSVAIGMSRAIAHARETGMYNMLGMLPLGVLKSVWALGVGSLHRMQLYRALRFVISFLFAVILLAILLEGGLLLLLIAAQTAPDAKLASADAMLTLASLLIAAVVLGIEYVQSMIVGAVTGLAIASHALDRLTAQLASMGLFLALQLLTYLVILGLWFSVLPHVMLFLFPDHSPLVVIVAAFLRLFTIYAVREGIIICVWHLFVRRLDTDADERRDFEAHLGRTSL